MSALSIASIDGRIQSPMIVTRFAPSPTGSLHIGGLRSALYPYALAKKNDGKFILRIEDTDQKREVPGATQGIQDLLKSFGIAWDEFYIQSERVATGIYKEAAEKLIADGHAFYCQCSGKNAKKEGYSKVLKDPCRDSGFTEGAVKLMVPQDQQVSFSDYVHGGKEIVWNTNDIADAVLLKSDGFPTYHLAVVVDDHAMEVTHVLRGHDWLPSTPIHLLVYQYLGYDVPAIGHLTDILDPDGGKLSKRKGSTSCEGLLQEGYLPEALVNFVILLGWAPKDNRELFTLEEFVDAFDPKGFQTSNPVFNREKLDWFNGQYVRKLSVEDIAGRISTLFEDKYPREMIEKTVPLIHDRIVKLTDYPQLAGFFFDAPTVDNALLGERAKEHLTEAIDVISTLHEWSKEALDSALIARVKEKEFKTGEFFMDIRVAITGMKFTPPINDSMLILGKEESIRRLTHAIT